MRRRACSFGVVAPLLIAACALGDTRTCGPAGTGASVGPTAEDFAAGAFVDGVRADGAAAFLYEPGPGLATFPDEAVYVMCVGDGVSEAGYTNIPILSDDGAASAFRLGAGMGTVNGEARVDWGWMLGRVDDDRIAGLEVHWDEPAGGGWATPVEPGLFLIAVPAGVPIDANLRIRFVDADGALVWEQPAGG